MIRGSFPAMGTEVIVVCETPGGIEAARRVFARIEQQCSRFDPTSELSWLNAQPAGEVAISPVLSSIFETANRLREATDGLVDPAVGKSVIVWGYDTSFDDVTDKPTAPASETAPDWSITPGQIRRPAGVVFDLGGVAKGWACDQAVESGIALIASAGGDMRSSTTEAVAEVLDPWDGRAASVKVGAGALATSSVSRRRWRVAGRVAHHIIDPRTGQPACSPILSASVVAARAADAEAGAKAVLLHGESGLEWADRQPWVHGAVAIWDTGAVYATGSLEMVA